MAGEVSDGADAQMRSVDSALSGVNQLSASLKETATQAEVVTASTESLVSSINEVAASIEEVTAASARLLASLETNSPARNREEEAAKARLRSEERFPRNVTQ